MSEVRCLPKRQYVAELLNVNNLAYHQIWSTIKTLPEPSSMDHGPWTEVTGAFSQSGLDTCSGWGLDWVGCCALKL